MLYITTFKKKTTKVEDLLCHLLAKRGIINLVILLKHTVTNGIP